jgi:hypothetical protein
VNGREQGHAGRAHFERAAESVSNMPRAAGLPHGFAPKLRPAALTFS